MKASRAMMKLLKTVRRIEHNQVLIADRLGIDLFGDDAPESDVSLLEDFEGEDEEAPATEFYALVEKLIDEHTKDELVQMLGEYQDDRPSGNKARVANDLAPYLLKEAADIEAS